MRMMDVSLVLSFGWFLEMVVQRCLQSHATDTVAIVSLVFLMVQYHPHHRPIEPYGEVSRLLVFGDDRLVEVGAPSRFHIAVHLFASHGHRDIKFPLLPHTSGINNFGSDKRHLDMV